MTNQLKHDILEKISVLASAAFGLVAALAWNEAIQELVKTIFPAQNALWGKFAYAILITAVVVVVTYFLGKMMSRLQGKIDAAHH